MSSNRLVDITVIVLVIVVVVVVVVVVVERAANSNITSNANACLGDEPERDCVCFFNNGKTSNSKSLFDEQKMKRSMTNDSIYIYIYI